MSADNEPAGTVVTDGIGFADGHIESINAPRGGVTDAGRDAFAVLCTDRPETEQ
jgi:hypothetical protein